MNIILLYNFLPYSNAESGGQVYIFNFIKYFSKKHKIFLLCISEKKNLNHVKELEKLCEEIIVIQRERSKFSIFLKFIRSIFNNTPQMVEYNFYPKLNIAFKRVINKYKIDLIYFERIFMYPYIEKNLELLKNIKIYLREDALAYLELSSIIYFRLKKFISSIKDISNLKNPLVIVTNFIVILGCCQYRKVKKYQISAWKNVDFISAINIFEKRLIEKEVNKKVKIYPHGIDLLDSAKEGKEREQNSLVFLGNYSYAPNIEGISWFIKYVFTKFLKLNKDVKLYLIGPNPSKEILYLKKIFPYNLKILGWVDNPIEHLKTKSIFINPIFIGGGQRVKLLFALKAKIPIISTKLGISGFPYPPKIGKEILLAENPKEFIITISRLLKDKDLRDYISQNGYNFLIKNYQWHSIFKNLEKDLEALVTISR